MKHAYQIAAIGLFGLFAVATSAHAGSNCYQLGSQWVCNGQDANGGNWSTRTYNLGSNRITNGTSSSGQNFTRSCHWLGSQYVCN